MVAISNSKRYTIEFDDGTREEVHGLKAFGVDRSIPYVTLFKSFQNKTPIKKYKIRSIALV